VQAVESHDPNGASLELHLPAAATSVPLGRRAAAQFAEEVGCCPATLWRVRLAVSEAISNAVLHAYGPEDQVGAELTLRAQARPERVVLSVVDHGTGMRPRPDSPGVGLGLGIIATSCDDLEIGAGSDGGTIVQMVFLR
jgi:serine/threonine-protein kinase RsbW